MTNHQTFEGAFTSPDPYTSLRRTVKGLLTEGTDREQLRAELEAFRRELRHHGRESDDDIVLDVLDDLTGWTSPHRRL